MTDIRIVKFLVPLAAAAVLLVGCGGSSENAAGSSAASSATGSSAGTPSSTGIPELTDEQTAPDRLTVDVTIRGGQVTPTNAELETKVGQPVVIRVNSDAADELHVHSNPEHSFPIAAKNGQQFQFTVEVPGKVDVELHELSKTVATITVQQ